MTRLSRHCVAILAGLSMLAGIASAADSCLEPKPSEAQPVAQTFTTTASDGVCLRAFAWQPGKTPVRGVVVITHGIRDYALRYQDFARQLNDQGYAVYAQDLRGHAHSGGQRQRFDSMAQLVADTEFVVQRAQKDFPNTPLFVYGHSLGGLVTTQYALSHGDQLSGVVLSGAALVRPASVSSFSVGAAKVIGALLPWLEIVAVDDSEFSRDPAVIAELAKDPLVSHAKLPAASAVASIAGMADASERMGTLKMPLLVLYGLSDKVNPTQGSDALVKAAGSTDKTLKTYPGVYHDMLHEPERDVITADVIAWLNARTVCATCEVKQEAAAQ